MPRGSRRLPRKCIRLLGEADLILHAGDFVSAAVLDELGELVYRDGAFLNGVS